MRNEFKVTRKRYMQWVLESMFRGARCVFMVFWSVFGGCLLGIGFTGVMGFESLYIILGMFCIYQAFFRSMLMGFKQYLALARNYGQENWTRVIDFEEDGLVVTEGNVTVQLKYEDILSVKENEERILLQFKNKTFVRLYKDSFVGTDWPEVREKMRIKDKLTE